MSLVKKAWASVQHWGRHGFRWLMYRVFAVLPIQKNKVVFVSAAMMARNPKYIFDEFSEQERQKLDLVCLSSSPKGQFPGARNVDAERLQAIREMVTAKAWVSDSRQMSYVHKRKQQRYIMTWHGAMGAKKIEKDIGETLPKAYIQCAVNDSKMCDLMVAETDWVYRIMKRAFWYDGEILQAEFVNKAMLPPEENLKKVKRVLGIREEQKIILYVPTFRMDHSTDCYNIEYDRVLREIQELSGEEYVFIVRLHENSAEFAKTIAYSQMVINGTYYPSVDELISACDILISDYSGCVFAGYKEYKKVILYAPDLEEYMQKERGFTFDFRKDLPSPIAKTNEELIDAIVKYDTMKYTDQMKKLNELVGYFGGDAAKSCKERIMTWIEKGGIKQ